MHDLLQAIESDFDRELLDITSLKALEGLRTRFLGRKSALQGVMQKLKELTPEARAEAGRSVNTLKEKVEHALEKRLEELLESKERASLEEDRIDVSLPGRIPLLGRAHPVLAMLDEVITVLSEMGFAVQYGPHIESDYYNFEALNYPKDHPAREMQDTFYLSSDFLLRTHNTSMQIRLMEGSAPPIRVICPGKCFRNEEVDARSHLFFHQVDGLYIDKGVTFTDLIVTLEEFFQRLFGPDVQARFRPSYFPFVEPGLEADISCLACEGKGCSVCKQTGWLEVLGAGLVHPSVLRTGGIDPELYSGYAWGMGIERLVMIKYRIKDIRLFSENDLRFLEQFP